MSGMCGSGSGPACAQCGVVRYQLMRLSFALAFALCTPTPTIRAAACRIAEEVRDRDVLGIVGEPFQLPPLVRQRRDEDVSSDDDDAPVDNRGAARTALLARRDVVKRQVPHLFLRKGFGLATLRDHSRNSSSHVHTGATVALAPEFDPEVDAGDEEDVIVAPVFRTTRPLLDRTFCPITVQGGRCKANYKLGNGKSMQSHIVEHFADPTAGEACFRQFVDDGQVRRGVLLRLVFCRTVVVFICFICLA